jgi:hypothetical protein
MISVMRVLAVSRQPQVPYPRNRFILQMLPNFRLEKSLPYDLATPDLVQRSKMCVFGL